MRPLSPKLATAVAKYLGVWSAFGSLVVDAALNDEEDGGVGGGGPPRGSFSAAADTCRCSGRCGGAPMEALLKVVVADELLPVDAGSDATAHPRTDFGISAGAS